MSDDFLDYLLEPDYDPNDYYGPKVQALSLEARKHVEADGITELILANCMQTGYSQTEDNIYYLAIGLDTWPVMANLSPYGKCIFDQIFGVSTRDGYLIDYPSLMTILETLEQLEIKYGASATSLELTDFVPYLSDSPIQLTVWDAELINATVEAMLKMKNIKEEIERFDALGTRYSKIISLRHLKSFKKLIPTLFTEIDTILESEQSDTIKNFLAETIATPLLVHLAEEIDRIANHPLKRKNPQPTMPSTQMMATQKARTDKQFALATDIVFELYRYAIKISLYNQGKGDADEEIETAEMPIAYEDLDIIPITKHDRNSTKEHLIRLAREAINQAPKWLSDEELKALLIEIDREISALN